MRVSTLYRSLFIILCVLFVLPAHATVGMQELGDSLTAYTGFSPLWASPVKVKNLRVNGNNITVRTNTMLKDVRWTPALVRDVKKHVSRWVLGHDKGNVTLFGGRTNIEDLVTDCSRGIMVNGKAHDLTDRNIVLYPSHGLYFNRQRQEWIWQRATLWTTVEDLYSQEYVRLIRTMLENAGATVLSPRPGIEQQQPGLSGMPQWTEGARYWLMAQNADTTLWDLYEGDEYKDDMKCRAMWTNSLTEPVDLCLAFHTDGMDSGNDTSIVGTLAIYSARDDDGKYTLRDGRDRERINRNIADWIQTQITNDLRHIAPEWTRRQLREANYCETRVPVVPSLILELLSHKNMADMRYGLDPQFRFAASRAVYKGILRALNGKAAIVQPLPVRDLAIDASGKLRWIAPLDSLEPTAIPTYYLVYVQQNDGEWNVQQVENTTQLQLELQPDIQYNLYVVAGNDGGLSLPSPVISAYRSPITDNRSPILIIDAFHDTYGVDWYADSLYAGIVPGSYACEDRFSCAYIGQQWNYRRSDEWTDDDNCGFGSCYRDHAGQLTVGNTRDYAVQHGCVLRKMHISYVSCTGGIAQWDSTYTAVDIVCGRNRTPLTERLCQQIDTYLAHGGRVLMSTDHFSALDPSWARTHLHASFYAAHATRSGRIKTHPDLGRAPRSGYQLLLEPNEEQLFTCTPEGLKPTDDAVPMASYDDMRCPAAVGSDNTLVFAFPLEAVFQFDKLYRHSIEWLLNK